MRSRVSQNRAALHRRRIFGSRLRGSTDQPDHEPRSAGALDPNADHWFRHAIRRSIRRLTPKPRGSRTVDRRSDEAGAKEGRARWFGGSNVQFCLCARRAIRWLGWDWCSVGRANDSVAKRVHDERVRFRSHRTVAEGLSPSPSIISPRRWGNGGVQGMIRTRV